MLRLLLLQEGRITLATVDSHRDLPTTGSSRQDTTSGPSLPEEQSSLFSSRQDLYYLPEFIPSLTLRKKKKKGLDEIGVVKSLFTSE